MIGSPLNPGNRIRMKMGQTPQVCLTESVMHDSPQHPVIADLGPNESTKLMFFVHYAASLTRSPTFLSSCLSNLHILLPYLSHCIMAGYDYGGFF